MRPDRWAPDPWQGISRVQRAQKRLADGSLDGLTNLASPVSSAPVGGPVATALAAGGAPPTAYFGTSGTSVEDLGAGGTNIHLYEQYNYGALFTLDAGNEWINIARPCIVQVTAWFLMAAGPAGRMTLELYGLDTDIVPDEHESVTGGRMVLRVAATDLWDPADDLRMFAYHDDTGSTYSTNVAALAVTYVRDA